AWLARELGVSPGAETQRAYEAILGLDAAVQPAAGDEPPAPPAPARPAVRPSDRPATPARGPAERVPLVGREPEWAELMDAWDRMTTGEARLVVISGEAGIGKTRLAAALCEWAEMQGVRAARTRAYAAEGRLSYAP